MGAAMVDWAGLGGGRGARRGQSGVRLVGRGGRVVGGGRVRGGGNELACFTRLLS